MPISRSTRTIFQFLLDKLSADSTLGLVGTPFQEISGRKYDYRFVNIEHVSGACQVFRRECFEAIGGYMPVKGGSIDHIAVITARMKGWKTRTFTEKSCLHHRAMGTAGRSLLKSRFKLGMKDYSIGNHPTVGVFQDRSSDDYATRIRRRSGPWGRLSLGSFSVRVHVRYPPDLIAFHRREQMQRLNRFIRGNRSVGTVKPSSHCA